MNIANLNKEEILKEIERINNIEKEQQLSEYLEWLRDYYYDRLEELNESMS